jgi:hypothetical protein
MSESATPEPVTPEPVTPEPVTPEPVTTGQRPPTAPESATREPTTSDQRSPVRAQGGLSGLRVPPGPLTAVAGLVLVLLAAILLREIAGLIVPVIFGLFLALLTYPLIPALQRRGIKHGGALAITLIVVLAVILVTAGMIALSVAELVIEIPKYQNAVAA